MTATDYKGQIYIVRSILKLVKLGCRDFKLFTVFQGTAFIRHNLSILTCKLDFYIVGSISPHCHWQHPACAFIVFWGLPVHSFNYTAAELTEKACVFKTLQRILTFSR